MPDSLQSTRKSGSSSSRSFEEIFQESEPSALPRVLTRSIIPSLTNGLDASDVIECYALVRSAPLHGIANSTIHIEKMALGMRYRPPGGGAGSKQQQRAEKRPVELTIEYGPQRFGPRLHHEAMPIVHVTEDESSYIGWENVGRVFYTTEILKENYLSSYYMASMTGAVLNKLLVQAVEFSERRRRYQPFAVYSAENEKKIRSSSSSDFAEYLWKHLAKLGVEIEPILPPPMYEARLWVDSWEKVAPEPSTANEVANFYQKLYQCLESIATNNYAQYQPTAEPTASPMPSIVPTNTLMPSNMPTRIDNQLMTPAAKQSETSFPSRGHSGQTSTPEPSLDTDTPSSKLSPEPSALITGDDNEEEPKDNPRNLLRVEDNMSYSSGSIEDNDGSRNRRMLFNNNENDNGGIRRRQLDDGTVRSIDDDIVVITDDLVVDNADDDTVVATDDFVDDGYDDEDDNDFADDGHDDDDDDDNNDDDYVLFSAEPTTPGPQTPSPTLSPTKTPTPVTALPTSVEAENGSSSGKDVEIAQQAASEAHKAADEAKNAAQTEGDTKAADAAQAAADAAQLAADATSNAAAQAAMDGLLSGDGSVMASIVSTCFTNPQYELMSVDDNGAATTNAFLYRDGSNYYKLNLTSPYIEIVRLNKELPRAFNPSDFGSGGDFIDYALASLVMGTVFLLVIVLLQQMGYEFFSSLFRLQRWFFNPRKYDYEGNTMDATNGAFSFGEDAIPLSMGGRLTQISPILERPAAVPMSSTPKGLAMPVLKNGNGSRSQSPAPTYDSNGLGDVELSNLSVNRIRIHSRSDMDSQGSLSEDEFIDTDAAILPERLMRDPDLVDMPNLKSTSKVAVPVGRNAPDILSDADDDSFF